MEQFDVVVIGAGPAGYVAAIRCAQLGLRTACVDQWLDAKQQPLLGGTCLNVGCIPSKVLLESSELFEKVQHTFPQHGITFDSVMLDLPQMMQRKEKVVASLTGGVAALFKANGITLFSGQGRLLANKQVAVMPQEGEEQLIAAQHIILAPGSRPRALGILPFDGERVVDSTAALSFESVVDSLAVIGAGIIGLELGSVWRRLGSQVTLFETADVLLPAIDRSLGKQAQKIFQQQGLNFRFASHVTACKVKKDGVKLHYSNHEGEQSEHFDRILVAVGRVPNTEAIADAACGLQLDKWGRIEVDDQCRTALPGVYAIGDAVRGPMLAHKGSEEGMMVAALIAGQYARVNYEAIPFVVYTQPELAWCGKTEEELKQEGASYRVGTFSFAANGRARAIGETAGMIKVLSDAVTDRVLGIHMLGPQVSELIGQAVLAMEFGASSEDLAMTVFAHPSLSEVLHEAALDVDRRAIHKLRS